MNGLLMKKIIKIVAIILACVIIVAGGISIGLWEYGKDVYAINKADNQAYQQAHMEYLREEFYNDYTPVNEQAFCDFDLEQALNSGVRYNEVAFLATHNSYQRLVTETTLKYQIPFKVLSLGLKDFNKDDFESDTLTNQFEQGIRSIEIDVEAREENGKTTFTVMHKPVFDSATTCLDFATALDEIILWSEHNPNHLPISILIESKQDVAPLDGLKIFGIEHVEAFDNLLKEKLGDKLLTPSHFLDGCATFEEMRETRGWLPLKDMLGKVVVILHKTGMTEKYVERDRLLRTQAMIPSVEYKQRNKDYAGIVIDNSPKKALKRMDFYSDGNFIVRTRADSYPKWSKERYEFMEKCSSQIVTTDFPPRTSGVRPSQRTYSFGGYTVKLI